MRLMPSCAVVLLAALATAAHAEDVALSYVLSIDKPECGTGNVKLTISGLASKGFSLVRSTGVGEAWFDAVKASGPSGKQYQVAPVEGGYYVTTDGAPDVVISYVVRPGQVGEYGHLGLITSEYAALDCGLVLLLPGSQQEVKSAELAFSGPAGWKAVTNWTASDGVYRPDASFAPLRLQLEEGLLCFGDFRAVSSAVGTNKVDVYTLASYAAPDRTMLAETLVKIYKGIYDVLGFETGRAYAVVALPPAPDGLATVAGAWADGQALTLAGTLEASQVLALTKEYARFIMNAYFSGQPYGVKLEGDDVWLYPAALGYAEGLGVISTKKLSENLFYADLYTRYAVEAASDTSPLDLPLTRLDDASPAARAFMANWKAPILLMRLDYEIRAVTGGSDGVGTFLKGLYADGKDYGRPVKALVVLEKLTGADFTEFYGRFVRARRLILPTWPAFMEMLQGEKAVEPGPVVAEVDGVPIYEREVQIMSEAIHSEGMLRDETDIRRMAITALENEKLIDRELASYRIDPVPEAFWRLRLVLPTMVLRQLVTLKRQTLKDVLYDDWLNASRKNVTITETPGALNPPQPQGDHPAGAALQGAP